MKSLGIGAKPWYAAVRTLEDLGLVVGMRALGGKKIRYFTLTREGQRAIAALEVIGQLVSNSKTILRLELASLGEDGKRRRKCEILCMLLRHAEREANRSEMLDVIHLAEQTGHPEEALLGEAVLKNMSGDAKGAIESVERAKQHIDTSDRCAAEAHLDLARAEALGYLGEARASAGAWHELRKAAKRQGDMPIVVEAHIGLGNLLLRQGLVADASREYGKGLECSRKGHLADAEAKVLSRLAVAEYVQNTDRGLARSEEALKLSLASGALLTQARVKADRALMLASRGDQTAALKLMGEAGALFQKLGSKDRDPSFQRREQLLKEVLASRGRGAAEEGRQMVWTAIR
jgi:tetratricopeptide (TPR) repeat protein